MLMPEPPRQLVKITVGLLMTRTVKKLVKELLVVVVCCLCAAFLGYYLSIPLSNLLAPKMPQEVTTEIDQLEEYRDKTRKIINKYEDSLAVNRAMVSHIEQALEQTKADYQYLLDVRKTQSTDSAFSDLRDSLAGYIERSKLLPDEN
jgi:hypothetical protein